MWVTGELRKIKNAVEQRSEAKEETMKCTDVIVDIDAESCVFCGICEVMCPFGAIRLIIDDKRVNPVLNSKVFPELIRNLEIDVETCMRVNLLCERICVDACPLKLLQFKGSNPPPYINDLNKCPMCGRCEAACKSVIHVQKLFDGEIEIHNERCQAGCNLCVYQCPVNALYMDEEGKVKVLAEFCIFCGVCQNFCPVDGAINIKLNHVRAGSAETNIWKQTVEKLFMYKPFQSKVVATKKYASWPKITKNNSQKELKIERKIYLRSYVLMLDKELCRKCRICQITCPKGAIKITRFYYAAK